MHNVYILLGGNEGDPLLNFGIAKRELENSAGKILRESSLYQTAAWGYSEQPDFLNQVVIIETLLSPLKLLKVCLGIEFKIGRIRTTKNAPRLIDLDILFYDESVIDEPALQIPHPRISERKFVLVPLCELSPQFSHPLLHKTVCELLIESSDSLDVKKI